MAERFTPNKKPDQHLLENPIKAVDRFFAEQGYYFAEGVRNIVGEVLVANIQGLEMYYHPSYLDQTHNTFKRLSTPVIYQIIGHHGHADAPIARRALQVLTPDIKFAAAKDYWSSKLHRRLFRYSFVNTFDVSRNRSLNSKNELDYAKEMLMNGYSLAFFIEGGRQWYPRTPLQERKYHDGASLIARDTNYQFPIVPVLMRNTEYIIGKNDSWFTMHPKEKPLVFVDKPLVIDPENPPKNRKEVTQMVVDRALEIDTTL